MKNKILPITQKNALCLDGNTIDNPLCFFSHPSLRSLTVRLVTAEPHFTWNIITLISVLDFFLSWVSCLWQRWDISICPTARSLFQLKDICCCCCCRGKFQGERVPLSTHSLLCINQILCSSGWVLGFAPHWVMMRNIVSSGSQCSCLAGTTDVWLRHLEKCGYWSVGWFWTFWGSSVFSVFVKGCFSHCLSVGSTILVTPTVTGL